MISQKVGSFDFIFVFLTYSCSFSEIGWLDLVTAILCFTCIEVGPRRIQFASRIPVWRPAWCGTPTENPEHSTGHVDSRETSPGRWHFGRSEQAAERWAWLRETGECRDDRDHMSSWELRPSAQETINYQQTKITQTATASYQKITANK